jgi:hypothetical protein
VIYPPSAFLPVTWLGLLPHAVAVGIWVTVMFAASAATLRVLGVRDLRCYFFWLLSPPILSTIVIGNATTIVVLLAALLWRWRHSPDRAGLSLAAAIAIKLFLAPLAVWLVVRRRYRAAVYALIAAPLAVLVAWACIRFSALTRYPAIVSANDHTFAKNSPFLQGLVLQLRGSATLSLAIGLAAAAVLLCAARAVGDLGSYSLALAACVLLAPVAQIGYIALLFVPFIILRPVLSKAWWLLAVTYAHWYYSPIPYTSAALSVVTLLLAAALVLFPLREERRGRSAGLLRVADASRAAA